MENIRKFWNFYTQTWEHSAGDQATFKSRFKVWTARAFGAFGVVLSRWSIDCVDTAAHIRKIRRKALWKFPYMSQPKPAAPPHELKIEFTINEKTKGEKPLVSGTNNGRGVAIYYTRMNELRQSSLQHLLLSVIGPQTNPLVRYRTRILFKFNRRRGPF